jgi:hypothetical protein
LSEPREALAPTSRVEETGLSTITGSTSELAPTSAAAAQQFEIQSAIVLARKFPRNEDAAFEKLMRSCKRTGFAEEAEYSFPRGGANVVGPSVTLAREAARVWGNIRYGLEILRDDKDGRQIRGWAWDLETNTKVAAEDEFQKLIQRKRKDGKGTEWLPPDERDLRELTNRRGAILIRNCILQLLPSDLIDDARNQAHTTLRSKAEQDPDGARKQVILAFGGLNITPAMLEAYLGHPVGQSSPDELTKLRTIFQSVRDGNSKWDDYLDGGAAANGGNGGNGGGAASTAGPRMGMPKAKAKPAEPPADTAPGQQTIPTGGAK